MGIQKSPIIPGDADWNNLEEMIRRCGLSAVLDAIEILGEQTTTEPLESR